MRYVLPALIALCFPAMAAADGYKAVSQKSEFLNLVGNKELRIGLYNLKLRVRGDGQISGSALGWEITGDWSWKDGYFCRQMDWSGKDIAYDCQLVEQRGEKEMRFTSEKGRGQSATFRLR